MGPSAHMQISGTFDVALGGIPESADLSEYRLLAEVFFFMEMLNNVIILICTINFKQN